MVKIKNYNRLDDFIFACKDKLSNEKEVFYDIVPAQVEITVRNAQGQQVRGLKNVSSLFLSSVSEDGRLLVTATLPLCEHIYIAETTQEQVLEYRQEIEAKLGEMIHIFQAEWAVCNLKSGKCGAD